MRAKSFSDKKNRNLNRKKASKESIKRILIVCEGEKTEPRYFNSIISQNRLNSANIEVASSNGSAPINVFNTAKKKSETVNKDDLYDQIYCVFDKDKHRSFTEAIREIETLNKRLIDTQFFAIISVRQFEYWLLLHLVQTNKPSDNHMKNELAKAFESTYSKKFDENTMAEIFTDLNGEHYLTAKKYAEEQLKILEKNGSKLDLKNPPDPFTNVYVLTEVLRTLKK